MSIIRKIGDDYYIFKRKKGIYRGGHIPQDKFSPIFCVKAGSSMFDVYHVYAPPELHGKKIMLKVVVIDEQKKGFRFEDLESFEN